MTSTVGQVVMVRHGETEWNRAGRLQGRTDIALSEAGIEQARAMAQHLAPTLTAPVVVATSPLRRASETAAIVAEQLRTGVEIDERLVERSYGE